jgi:hypothetical protein
LMHYLGGCGLFFYERGMFFDVQRDLLREK